MNKIIMKIKPAAKHAILTSISVERNEPIESTFGTWISKDSDQDFIGSGFFQSADNMLVSKGNPILFT